MTECTGWARVCCVEVDDSAARERIFVPINCKGMSLTYISSTSHNSAARASLAGSQTRLLTPATVPALCSQQCDSPTAAARKPGKSTSRELGTYPARSRGIISGAPHREQHASVSCSLRGIGSRPRAATGGSAADHGSLRGAQGKRYSGIASSCRPRTTRRPDLRARGRFGPPAGPWTMLARGLLIGISWLPAHRSRGAGVSR